MSNQPESCPEAEAREAAAKIDPHVRDFLDRMASIKADIENNRTSFEEGALDGQTNQRLTNRDAAYIGFLKENHYYNIKQLPDGRWCAMYRFLFTWAIITGKWGDMSGYDDRWCYHKEERCLQAWREWNGEGEPTGWQRHPLTGRYQDMDNVEFLLREEEAGVY